MLINIALIFYISCLLLSFAGFIFTLFFDPSWFESALGVFTLTFFSWVCLISFRCKSINRTKPPVLPKEWCFSAAGYLIAGFLFLISTLMKETILFGVMGAYLSFAKGFVFLVLAKRIQSPEGKATLF
jgi:uncharacterized membrane protein YfcA